MKYTGTHNFFLEVNKNVILERSLYNCLMRPVSFFMRPSSLDEAVN